MRQVSSFYIYILPYLSCFCNNLNFIQFLGIFKEYFNIIVVTPVLCLNNCSCYHRQDLRVNVYDCSHGYEFPMNIPNNTNWLLCSNSHIYGLPDDIPFLKNITNLNISNNNIQTISEKSLTSLDKFRKLKMLDISNNVITIIPKELQHFEGLEAVFLAGNPIGCNCDMLWLISWMNKFLPDGTRIVRDYEKVKCSKTNKLIYKLTAVEMGCFPKTVNFMAESNSWSRGWNHNISHNSNNSGGEKMD